ncbi:MAG: hypothetical protein ABI972_16510 [Acidobacteriota bacterium]
MAPSCMDHEFAIKNHFAERYLLRELTGSERDEFEAHFFECTVCADEVKSADAFIENARAALAAVPAANASKAARWWEFTWWKPSFGLAGMAAALVIAAYPWYFVVPGLEKRVAVASAPQAVTPHVLRAESRGEPAAVAAQADGPLLLVFDVNAAETFPKYFATIEDSKAATVMESEVPAPSRSESFHLLLPAPRLEPGRYVLIMRGTAGDSRSGTEIGRYYFQIEAK